MPKNRVYVSPNEAAALVRDFTCFSAGQVASDDAHAASIKIGRPSDTYRRIAMSSPFGPVQVLGIVGHLRYPYGDELSGYDVANVDATLAKATHAGAREPWSSRTRWLAAAPQWRRFPEAPTMTQSLA